jgi:LCP family protein required for cell wall assembly
MIPLVLLMLVTSALAVVGYRVESLMTSVHAVSTPPPVVTDATYSDEDDPDTPATPVTVDTGPAVAALEAANEPVSSEGGFTDRIQQAASNSADLLGGAAVAAGLKNQGADAITLLFMGVDAQPGAAIDIGVRPDVLMLIRLEPETRTCRLLAIPRDTRVELPGYGESKINHALMVGGIPYQILVTEDFLGIEIDHYALMDFVAFEQIVDSLGGISVTVPEDLVKNGETRFTAGTHHFDGEQALAYARFRETSTGGDAGRIERRWDLLSGMANAVQGRDLVSDANEMLPTLQDHFRTDLSATDITEIARHYGTGCTSPSARAEQSVDVLEGTRVRLPDPIMGQSLYFNVVSDNSVDEMVEVFMYSVTNEDPLAPPATPVASPTALTEAYKKHPQYGRRIT